MKLEFALIAALLAILGNVPYVRDVLRGKTTPHPYTWFVGSIVSCIVLFGQVAKGAGLGAIPTAVAEVFTIGIFLLSLRYGFKRITRTDSIFLILALLAIVPWLLTKDPTLSVVFAVAIDVIAFAPTIRKTFHAPRSETMVLYGANFARHLLSLFALEAYSVATTLHSAVMLVLSAGMVALILMRSHRR